MKNLFLVITILLFVGCATSNGTRVELTNGKRQLGCVVEQRTFWLELYAVRLDDGRLVKAYAYDFIELDGECT